MRKQKELADVPIAAPNLTSNHASAPAPTIAPIGLGSGNVAGVVGDEGSEKGEGGACVLVSKEAGELKGLGKEESGDSISVCKEAMEAAGVGVGVADLSASSVEGGTGGTSGGGGSRVEDEGRGGVGETGAPVLISKEAEVEDGVGVGDVSVSCTREVVEAAEERGLGLADVCVYSVFQGGNGGNGRDEGTGEGEGGASVLVSKEAEKVEGVGVEIDGIAVRMADVSVSSVEGVDAVGAGVANVSVSFPEERGEAVRGVKTAGGEGESVVLGR